MGIREGLLMRQFLDTRQSQIDEAKYKAQLYKSQADHYTAQTNLVNLNMSRLQQYMTQMAQPEPGPAPAPQPQTPLAASMAPMDAELSNAPLEQPPDLTPQQAEVIHQGLGPQTPTGGVGDRAYRAALSTGLLNEAAGIGNVNVNMAKQLQAFGQQNVLAELDGLEQWRYGLEKQGQWTPLAQKWYDAKRIGIFGRSGHAPQALAAGQEQTAVVPPSGQLVDKRTGQPTWTNPNAPPVIIPPGAGVGTRTIQTPHGPVSVPPVTLQQPAMGIGDVAWLRHINALRADLGKPPVNSFQELEAGEGPGTQPTAAPGKQIFALTWTDGQPGGPAAVEGASAADARAGVQRDFPGRTFTLQPQAGAKPLSPVAQRAKDTEAARAQTAQNIRVYGTPEPPPGASQATAGDVARVVKQGEQDVPVRASEATLMRIARIDSVVQASKELLDNLDKHPDIEKLLGSWWLDPKAAVARVTARFGGKATPEQREFLAYFGGNAAWVRLELIGLTQTGKELEGVQDYLPLPSAGAENIKASLKTVIKMSTQKRNAEETRLKASGYRVGAPGETPGTPAPAPGKTESVLERARRILDEARQPKGK